MTESTFIARMSELKSPDLKKRESKTSNDLGKKLNDFELFFNFGFSAYDFFLKYNMAVYRAALQASQIF